MLAGSGVCGIWTGILGVIAAFSYFYGRASKKTCWLKIPSYPWLGIALVLYFLGQHFVSDTAIRIAPVLAAFYNFFNIQLELLQPVGDQATVWSDYVKMGQSGLHHIRFDVDDQDRANQLMAEKGIGIWMEGHSLINPASRFTYYDSLDKLGFIVEAVTRA